MTVYYTVHGATDHPKWDSGVAVGSVADDFGLEERLGFRPRWCSGLYENSLAESWFSIWVASPLFVEVVSFIQSDKAVPIDALAWTQVRQQYMDTPSGQPGWLEEFERIFDVEGVPEYRLEYLVPDSPQTTRSLPVEILTRVLETEGAGVLARLTGLGNEGAEKLQGFFRHIVSDSKELAAQLGLGWPLGLENSYRCIVQTSGLPALLWMLGTDSPIDTCLLDIALNDFGNRAGCSYDRAQQLRLRWDTEPAGFTAGDFDEMFHCFKDAASEAAKRSSERMSRGTGRNDFCPCGSGRKFKKCHGARHDLEWYARRV